MGSRAKAGPKAFPETKWGWVRAAACASAPDPTIFFPEDHFNLKTEDGLNGYRAGIRDCWDRYCGACPVRAECEQHGLEKKEPAGIWGGLGVLEREELRRR